MEGRRQETKAWEGCLGCGTPAHPPATVQRGTRQELLLQVSGNPVGWCSQGDVGAAISRGSLSTYTSSSQLRGFSIR